METDNLILAQLRAIRSDLGSMRAELSDFREEMRGFRHRVHAQDTDTLLQAKQIAQLQVDVDRIKRRLEIVDDAG